MEMVEQLISRLALDATGSMQVAVEDQLIDFTPPWRRASLREELQRRAGFDIEGCDDEELQRRAAALRVDTGIRESRGRIIDKLLSSLVEPHLVQPTFLLDYPEEMSPLAKGKPDAPGYVERFEAFAFGMEIANSYTELNDPQVQRERFEGQEEIRRLYRGRGSGPPGRGLPDGHGVRDASHRRLWASASTGWSCCCPASAQSVTWFCSRKCGR